MGIQERRHAKAPTRKKGTLMKIKEFFFDFEAAPISDNILHGPITTDLMEYIQQRNEAKRKQSIELLGEKWLLHPSNIKRREAQ
jgi:hypothetical protein